MRQGKASGDGPAIPFGDCVCGTDAGTSDHRPWMAKIVAGQNSGDGRCSGSIINKRYILTVASCICHATSSICPTANGTFSRDIDATGKLGLSVTMGKDPINAKRIKRILIHPDYSPGTPGGKANPTNNIALVEMTEDMYTDDGKKDGSGNMLIQPICLPQQQASSRASSGYNDMSCTPAMGGGKGVPSWVPTGQSWLNCQGKSYVTFYSAGNSFATCFTNSYSPEGSEFRRCRGGKNCVKTPNPSKNNTVCQAVVNQRLHETSVPNTNASRLSVVETSGSAGLMTYCYPYNYTQDKPAWKGNYKNGWCYIGETGTDWGWCEKSCDTISTTTSQQEVEVDAFNDPSCTMDNPLNTEREFCTGSQVLTPAELQFTQGPNGKYNFVKENPEEFDQDLIESIKNAGKSSSNRGGSSWQHHNPCAGEAGASVWKQHQFYPGKSYYGGQSAPVVATLIGLLSRFDSDCQQTDNEYGSRSHNVNERVIPYLSWIQTNAFKDKTCSKTELPMNKTTVSTLAPIGKNSSVEMEVVVVSVWTEVCEPLTTKILLSTMIPSCIWIEDVTTPKTPATACHIYWVSMTVKPRPRILTCIPVTTCVTVPWEKAMATKKKAVSVQTICIPMSTCVTYWEQLKGSTVIQKTTCIYMDAPDPSFCVGYTCETVPPLDYPEIDLDNPKGMSPINRPIFRIVTSPRPKKKEKPSNKTSEEPTKKPTTPDNIVDGLIFDLSGEDQDEYVDNPFFETESPGTSPPPTETETPPQSKEVTDTPTDEPETETPKPTDEPETPATTEGGDDPPGSTAQPPEGKTASAPDQPTEDPLRRKDGRRQPQNARPAGKGTRGNNPRIEEIDPSEQDIREEEGGDRPIEETDEEVPVDTRRTRAPRGPRRENPRRRRPQGKGNRD